MKGLKINYSDRELQFIRSNCKLSRKELHSKFLKKFNRRDVEQFNLSSLCKRNKWFTGRNGQFKPGNIPHPNARQNGPNKTSFKNGHKPHNWKPIYSTRVSRDGYLEIKTGEPRTWRQAHVLLWKKHHGEIPERFCVCFKDGKKTNIATDNLELISKNENLQINKLRCSSFPEEVVPTVRVIGKLIALTQGRQGSKSCQET